MEANHGFPERYFLRSKEGKGEEDEKLGGGGDVCFGYGLDGIERGCG
jgi:hypothetical protein